jgi:hypothetical protein
MRRVRGAVRASFQAAHVARSANELSSALGRLEIPLERARGRLRPDKLLRYARSHDAAIRRHVARLSIWFRRGDIEPVLLELAFDQESSVREEAAESLARIAGLARGVSLLARARSDAVATLAELAGLEPNPKTACLSLEHLARHPSERVRRSVLESARVLLKDAECDESVRTRLRAIGRE